MCRYDRRRRDSGSDIEHFLLYFQISVSILKHLSIHLRDYNSILTASRRQKVEGESEQEGDTKG